MPTYTVLKRNVVGNQKVVTVGIAFDNSYPTGGEAFSPADIDPYAGANATFNYVSLEINDATIADNRFLTYDHTNKKIIVYTAVNTEATNASDQSAVAARALVSYGGATG